MANCQDCRCKDFEKCLKILNLMLDNEATAEQEEYFKHHVENCVVCFSHFNVERQIRQLLKSNIKSQPIPSDLAEAIRNKIVS